MLVRKNNQLPEQKKHIEPRKDGERYLILFN